VRSVGLVGVGMMERALDHSAIAAAATASIVPWLGIINGVLSALLAASTLAFLLWRWRRQVLLDRAERNGASK